MSPLTLIFQLLATNLPPKLGFSMFHRNASDIFCSFLAYRSHTSSRQTWAARIWEERFCYIFGDRQTTIVWLFKPARCPFKSKTVVLHAQNPLRFWNELLWFQELCNSATCPRNMMWIDVEVGWFKAILNMVDFPCSLRPWPTPWPLFSVRSCIRWMCCIDCIEDSASIKAVAGQDRHAKCSQFKHMFQAR